MLKITGIDREKCIKCDKCIPSCSMDLFSIKREGMEKDIVFEDELGFCFRCGHCISICPTEAILYEGADPPYNFKEAKKPEDIISYEDLMKFMRSRRSTRKFIDKEIPDNILENVIESMRYSLSASNRQNRRYIVITNKEQIGWLSGRVSRLLLKAKRYLKFRYLIVPFTKGLLRKRLLSPKLKISLETFLEQINAGVDRIFFHAPCVIIVHAPPYSKMTQSDAGIAITHGMLAAQSLGLGTCWIGFAQEYLWRSKKSRAKLGIPKNNNVYGVFILGYPELKFERAPPRREAMVEWKK